jgi:hypothetical protein
LPDGAVMRRAAGGLATAIARELVRRPPHRNACPATSVTVE